MRRAIIPIAGLLLLAAGCSQGSYGNSHGIRDAPVESAGNQNNGPAHIITFPNGFENVAFKCDGVVGIYTTTRQAAPVVIPNDPHCK